MCEYQKGVRTRKFVCIREVSAVKRRMYWKGVRILVDLYSWLLLLAFSLTESFLNMNIFFIFLGGSGATTRRVPQGENAILRSSLLNFYERNSIGNGGCFNIAIGK